MGTTAGSGDGEEGADGAEVRADDSDDEELSAAVHPSGAGELQGADAGAGVSGELSGGADAAGLRDAGVHAVDGGGVGGVHGEGDAGADGGRVGCDAGALHGVQGGGAGEVRAGDS